MANILIVDDEPAIREMIGFTLQRAGFEVQAAAEADQARAIIATRLPDLVLLDWMLPGLSGLDFACALRRDPSTRHLPIIMLTARTESGDKVRGLEAGIDDYVTKPFSPAELLLRIRAVLRRAGHAAEDVTMEVEGLCLDPRSHRVSANGQPLALGPTEFRLLNFLMSHPERVYSRPQLLDQVWSSNTYVEERTIDVHIRRLRKALAPSGHDRLIQTVRGAGYRFSAHP
jgi:two-component system phosphate regulon response regulator PhoB